MRCDSARANGPATWSRRIYAVGIKFYARPVEHSLLMRSFISWVVTVCSDPSALSKGPPGGNARKAIDGSRRVVC